MIEIKYIDGGIQNVNVDGSFYAVSLAPKNGKQSKLLPIDKAVSMAEDLAVTRDTKVHMVRLYDEDGELLHSRFINVLMVRERMGSIPKSESFNKELKLLKKEGRSKPFTQKWKWTF